jgi:REP element-mobilizing transposase RayT
MDTGSENIHKRHNVSVIIYHYACPAKYRRVVVSEAVDSAIKSTCEELKKRFEMRFLEIGADRDHVHFLIQTTPKRSASQIIRIVKSITAREVFMKYPEVSIVGKNANETVIAK